MAFEALNNAARHRHPGRAQRQRDVHLRARRRDQPVLREVLSSRLYNTVRRGGKEVLSMAAADARARAPRGRAHEGHGASRHAVRGVRLQLHRPDRRPRRRRAREHAREHPRPQRCRSSCTSSRKKGYGYRARRGRSDPLSRRDEVRSGGRHGGEDAGQAAVHAGVRRLALRHGGRRPAARRASRRRCAKAPGSCAFRRRFRRAISTSASPSSTR